MTGEFPWAPHQAPGRLGTRHVGGQVLEDRLAMVSFEGRLGVEEVDLAGATLHEQLDDRLGTRLEVRLLGSEIVESWRRRRRRVGGQQSRTSVEFASEQVGQGGAVEPVGGTAEKIAAGERVGHGRFPEDVVDSGQSMNRKPAELSRVWQ